MTFGQVNINIRRRDLFWHLIAQVVDTVVFLTTLGCIVTELQAGMMLVQPRNQRRAFFAWLHTWDLESYDRAIDAILNEEEQDNEM